MAQKYVWDRSDWPNFRWNSEALLQKLGQARYAQGRILVTAQDIGLEAKGDLIVEEAFATSAIEGEKLDRNTIRSSVVRRLGLPSAGLPPEERHVDGLVAALLDATTRYDQPLTAERLHGWHAGLFPTGYSGIEPIQVGSWRVGPNPMRVISGPMGGEKIHYEAPPSSQLSRETELFLKWWNQTHPNLDGLLRAGIAHFWFVTIHPYDDGNGRISRAITDMALSQDEKLALRLYNLSTQIIKERDDYYQILETCQKHTLDITLWLEWFLDMYVRAISTSEKIVEKALIITKFWQIHHRTQLNKRQIKVIQKMLEAEPEGFEGGMNNRKYVNLTGASRESAKRDLIDLEEKGILKCNPERGRSTSYAFLQHFLHPTLL